MHTTADSDPLYLSHKLIRDFQELYQRKIGFIPVVIVPETKFSFTNITDFVDVINQLIPKKHREQYPTIVTVGRTVVIVQLRKIFSFYARKAGFSYASIGKILGGKNHATIMHYIETFNHEMDTDPKFRRLFERATDLMTNYMIYVPTTVHPLTQEQSDSKSILCAMA